MHISVLGTSFNVKAYKEEGTVEAILEKGKISITGKIGSERIKEPIVLLPKQKVLIQQPKEFQNKIIVIEKVIAVEDAVEESAPEEKLAENAHILIEDHTNTELYTSWKDGQLSFRKERFEELAIKLERWYDVHIEIIDEEMKNWRFTGTFDKETFEQALHALSLSVPFDFKIDKNNIKIKCKSNY